MEIAPRFLLKAFTCVSEQLLFDDKKYLVGWLFRLNGPLRQYFSLYRAVSQREGERGDKL